MTVLQFIAASIGLAIICFGCWNAGKLGWSECRVFYWRAQAKEGWAKAAFWQQQAGDNARDALRWRLHLQDCARGGKTAAQRQKAPVLAMAARLRGEG